MLSCMNLKVSIIIPTKNGESTLKQCLLGISNQTYNNVEVIIVDSGSTDDTLTIASSFPFVKIHQIDPNEFNHGTTRNLGVSFATGELILMTVQDAYPVNNYWIEQMLLHFQDDSVVGVCGQQVVPHDSNKNPHEWFRPYSVPKPKYVQFTCTHSIKKITSKELYDITGWDNVNAMYKKSYLLDNPFEKVSFGEDMVWAKNAILNGHKIVYDYSCRVFHYHHSTIEYTYKRTFTTKFFVYKNFKLIGKRKNRLEYLKIIYRNFKFGSNIKWILFNWKKIYAENKAHEDFVNKLLISECHLDNYHEKICGIPPQGIQNGN